MKDLLGAVVIAGLIAWAFVWAVLEMLCAATGTAQTW